MPTLVQGGINWQNIHTGAYHTCGTNNLGVAYCWGKGSTGALGNGGTADRLVPTPVISGVAFEHIYGGFDFSCGLQRSSRAAIYCWGENTWGQLGIGTTTRLLQPGSAVSGGTKWYGSFGLAVGQKHACAIKDPVLLLGASVWCWGSNQYGQLGNNGVGSHQTRPVEVISKVGAADFRMVPIVAGADFNCGRRFDTGTMYCWGRGGSGSLGNGFFINRLVPFPVHGGFTYSNQMIHMGAGWSHMLAVRSDNTVMGWGDNSFYQLGDGTDITRPAPVVILPP